MKMILPNLRERRAIDDSLKRFFAEYREIDFHRAIANLCRFYDLASPRIRWFEYLDWGQSGGRTFENGTIHLVHPENWKRGRKYNSERRWIATVFHEMGHYVLWADAERKADIFAYRIVRGIHATTAAAEQAEVSGLASRASRRSGRKSATPRAPRLRQRQLRSR